MKEFESPDKSRPLVPKIVPSRSRAPTMEQLRAMTTDKLIKLLMSLDMAQPTNQPLCQMIIQTLQQREGNAFVQRLLGKSTIQGGGSV
jgi:hypothetical protein